MKRRALRSLTCSIIAVLALGASLVLGACAGPNPETAIREDLTASLDRIKNLDDATVEELVGSMDTGELESYGITGSDVVKSLLDGFDYEIGAITVDEGGESAVASVDVTRKSATDFYEQVEQAATDLVAELVSDPSSLELLNDEEAFNARVGEVLMETLDGVEPRQTTVEVSYSKTDDGWTASDTSQLSQIFA